MFSSVNQSTNNLLQRPRSNEVLASIDVIAHGQFGNWCIQHICEHGAPADRSRAIDHILRFATEYSMDQYASTLYVSRHRAALYVLAIGRLYMSLAFGRLWLMTAPPSGNSICLSPSGDFICLSPSGDFICLSPPGDSGSYMFRYVSTHVDLNVSLANGEAVFFLPLPPLPVPQTKTATPARSNSAWQPCSLRASPKKSQHPSHRRPAPTSALINQSCLITLKLYIYARVFCEPSKLEHPYICLGLFFSRYVSAHPNLNASLANSHVSTRQPIYLRATPHRPRHCKPLKYSPLAPRQLFCTAILCPANFPTMMPTKPAWGPSKRSTASTPVGADDYSVCTVSCSPHLNTQPY
jgi:hypothetical protein